MQITIAVCDDDAEQVKRLRGLLCGWSADKPFAVNISEYESAEQFLFEYPDSPCDLLLLDIEMGGLDGMSLARKLRAGGDMLPIIFITGYSEHISEGYDVEALHYLLKPLDSEKLVAVLDKYADRREEKTEEILISCDGRPTHVPTREIVYIEAFGRKTQIHFSDKSVSDCDMNIGKFGDLTGFIHCHRSYIVNLRYIRSIGRDSVSLDGGGEIPLSRRLYNEVSRKFIDFYKQ